MSKVLDRKCSIDTDAHKKTVENADYSSLSRTADACINRSQNDDRCHKSKEAVFKELP